MLARKYRDPVMKKLKCPERGLGQDSQPGKRGFLSLRHEVASNLVTPEDAIDNWPDPLLLN